MKECYDSKINIIYGDANNFQFDILRDEYSNLGTRGKRNFRDSFAIVDEVDNMLIDDSSKIAMLADTMPGMINLNIILVNNWQHVEKHLSSGSISLEYVEQLSSKLKSHMHDILSSIKTQEIEIIIPDQLMDFAKNQIDIWVENSIEAAIGYESGVNYLILPDHKSISRITPIDYLNTGILQSSTSWGDGLQQFLQIKHGLKITPETLITNFLSNKA